MIFGIGTDLVENSRLEPWLKKPKLLEKYFSNRELEDVRSSAHPAASLAARFAAKEAFGKALGRGLGGLFLKEIEAVRGSGGKPSLHLSGNAQQFCKDKGISSIHLSLSHEKEFSIAFVILEA